MRSTGPARARRRPASPAHTRRRGCCARDGRPRGRRPRGGARGLGCPHGDPVASGRRLWSQARAVGFPGCRVALAGSRTAARVAALNATEPVTVIPPGEERAALAAAPLAVLGLAPDLAVTLEGWGVRTVGELAALPRDALAMRLGPAGLRTHDLALGLDRDPFAAWTPPAFWDEAQGLEWEIDSLGALT